MNQQSFRASTSSAVRALLIGATYGVLASVSGTLWADFTQRIPVDWHGLWQELLIAAPAGALVGVILHYTAPFREHGIVQHYTSWVFACILAALVLMLPIERSEGRWGLWFALWGGLSVGIGLGAFARYVRRRR